MIPYVAQPRYRYSQRFSIFFPFATIPATMLHYPVFTGSYSPHYGMLLFSLHFMTNTPFFGIHPLLLSPRFPIPRMVQCCAYHHLFHQQQYFNGPPQPFLSHSSNLDKVQRIIFLGRFLVQPTHLLPGGPTWKDMVDFRHSQKQMP